MKNAILAVSLFLSITTIVSAQSATPTKAANQQLEELKDRLATKVAQLREVVKQAKHGSVTAVSLTGATLETPTKSLKVEFSDEIVVIGLTNGKRSTLSTDDIKKDDTITVFGDFDATLELLKASVIVREIKPKVERINGLITAVDEKNFTITLQTPEGRSLVVDIERSTKTSAWTKADGITKSGFSKLTTSSHVHVIGTPNTKKENTLTALRILDLGNGSQATTATPEASPSGSL